MGPPFFRSQAEVPGTSLSTTDELTEQIEEQISALDPEIELIALESAGPEGLRVYIDHPAGVDLALCEGVTNQLRDLLASYSLEVSSPGLDRPLTKPEHFTRFLGRRVRVKTTDDIDGQRSFTGTVADADEELLSLQAADGAVKIPFSEIRRSNLVPEPSGSPS